MIEVMIAVLLTAIATIGIMGLYTVESRASAFSRRTTEATILAQDQMERLRTTPMADATIGGGTAITDLNEYGQVVSGAPYTREWTTIAGSPPTFDDLWVSVSWDDDGVTKSVALRSRRNL